MPEDDYRLWADCCDGLFKHEGVHSVIDLACGTGTLSWLLSQKGYEVIGVDLSADMLSEAQMKGEYINTRVPPMFLNQALEELDLYGTADAAVCSMDSMNYLPPDSFVRALERIALFVEKGGLFIFDVNTPEKFRDMDGRCYIDESDGAYCAWSADYDDDDRSCRFVMDIFLQDSEMWRRTQEEHTEYAYSVSEIKDMLMDAGFIETEFYGGLPLRKPVDGEERLFIICRNGKKQ